MKKISSIGLVVIVAVIAGMSCSIPAVAQSTSPGSDAETARQAQTVSIPLTAIARDTLHPVDHLTESGLRVDIDGKPVSFELSRPVGAAHPAEAGASESPLNLLLILPLAAPVDRSQVLDQAIEEFSRERQPNWNVSILDDSGAQTGYTHDMKAVVGELKQIRQESPGSVDLHDWRVNAALAIAGMRDLPGRRVVLTLGDIFHMVAFADGELVMNNFEIADVAAAARQAGAMIYAAGSSGEVEALQHLSPQYSVLGTGPWLLVAQSGQIAGWITGSIPDAMAAILRDAAGHYEVILRLKPEQMDGRPHTVFVATSQHGVLLHAPPDYIAPNLARLKALANVSPALRTALENPSGVPASSPLVLATALAYFPHPDHKTGTQIATTGFFWTGDGAPPADLQTALELEMPMAGLILQTTIGELHWSTPKPVWSVSMEVVPGIYQLNVAAAERKGSLSAATTNPFTVAPNTNEEVLVSSLVLGKHCIFAPAAPAGGTAVSESVDYFRAGECRLRPDPSHYYSPSEVVWTLVRVTPTGKVAKRSPDDWKGEFSIVDADGHRIARESVHWLPAADGSMVASAAFSLNDPKLKLSNGEYDVVFKLKGPEVERDFQEDAAFTVYGVPSSESSH